jgi:hypothetical protein
MNHNHPQLLQKMNHKYLYELFLKFLHFASDFFNFLDVFAFNLRDALLKI